jgi:hypothetical protein
LIMKLKLDQSHHQIHYYFYMYKAWWLERFQGCGEEAVERKIAINLEMSDIVAQVLDL